MEILKFQKVGKNKYKVFFNNEDIVLYEEVIIKYNLLSNKNIDINTLEKILKENSFYEVYNIALNYIDIKMRTEIEIIKYLENKNFEPDTINKTIEKLKENNFLNEEEYIKAFINDKLNLSSSGPYKIKNELLKYNLNEEIIEKYLNEINSEAWIQKINKIISKKISLNKKMSKSMINNKLCNDLFNLGYDKTLIEECLSLYEINEEEIFKKEYEKAYNKLSKKYSGKDLEYRIKNYMIKKGFNYNSSDN